MYTGLLFAWQGLVQVVGGMSLRQGRAPCRRFLEETEAGASLRWWGMRLFYGVLVAWRRFTPTGVGNAIMQGTAPATAPCGGNLTVFPALAGNRNSIICMCAVVSPTNQRSISEGEH